MSKKALHKDLCSHLLINSHAALRVPPYAQCALFCTLSRLKPVTIEITRPKHQFNPFSLLAIMSHESETSIDSFVVQGPQVSEVVRLNPNDSCINITPDAKWAARMMRATLKYAKNVLG